MNSESGANAGHNSFIHDLQIASPCKADWAKMDGDEQQRFCGQCKLNVYNISAMTLPEAEKLVSGSEGRLCVRMYRRADGTVITQDCPVGLAAKFKRRMQQTFAYGTAVVTLLGAWFVNQRVGANESIWEHLERAWAGQQSDHGCALKTGPEQGNVMPSPRATMGEVAMPTSHAVPTNVPPQQSVNDQRYVPGQGGPRGYIIIDQPKDQH